MFTYLESILVSLVHTLPLEVFVFVASFVEEIIAPIPSPTVMLVAGSFAQIQAWTPYGLIALILIGAFGKTIGALVVYTISDKAEDVVMGKFGRFLGVTHADVARLQNKLGNGVRDYVLLTMLRALPIMPSVIISVGSGLLKIPIPLFFTSTFLGTIVRDGIYLYAGYVGAQALYTMINTSSNLETYIGIAVALSVFLFMGYRIFRKKQ